MLRYRVRDIRRIALVDEEVNRNGESRVFYGAEDGKKKKGRRERRGREG